MTTYKDLFFILSGENINLSKSEILSIFRLKNVKIRNLRIVDRLLILSCEKNISKYIATRVAFTHNVSEFLIESLITENSIANSLKNIDFENILKNKKNFAVRVQKIGHKYINSEYFESFLGKIIQIQARNKISVNLKNPEILFFGVFVQNKFFFGINIEQKIRSKFNEKSLKLRPFFHPSALNPLTARAMVNLSQIKEDGIFLDPFCGTGSILVEASMIGCRNVIGIDINPKMIKGASINLKHFSFKNINLILSDSIKIPLKKVSAIATDPPYGRSSSTYKKSLHQLLENFFLEIGDLLLSNKIITLSLPSHIDLSNFIDDMKLKVIDEFEQYIHSSLTRKIYVIQKK
ncbi:MAG: DNA methyltransferase [Candidatus Helarchaeota archaeon]